MDSTLQAGDFIYVPSMCLVELAYLVEKGRVPAGAMRRLRDALSDAAFGFRIVVLDLRVADAVGQVSRTSVPDLPDRVIAATAVALDLPLVTRDGKIRAAGLRTIW